MWTRQYSKFSTCNKLFSRELDNQITEALYNKKLEADPINIYNYWYPGDLRKIEEKHIQEFMGNGPEYENLINDIRAKYRDFMLILLEAVFVVSASKRMWFCNQYVGLLLFCYARNKLKTRDEKQIIEKLNIISAGERDSVVKDGVIFLDFLVNRGCLQRGLLWQDEKKERKKKPKQRTYYELGEFSLLQEIIPYFKDSPTKIMLVGGGQDDQDNTHIPGPRRRVIEYLHRDCKIHANEIYIDNLLNGLLSDDYIGRRRNIYSLKSWLEHDHECIKSTLDRLFKIQRHEDNPDKILRYTFILDYRGRMYPKEGYHNYISSIILRPMYQFRDKPQKFHDFMIPDIEKLMPVSWDYSLSRCSNIEKIDLGRLINKHEEYWIAVYVKINGVIPLFQLDARCSVFQHLSLLFGIEEPLKHLGIRYNGGTPYEKDEYDFYMAVLDNWLAHPEIQIIEEHWEDGEEVKRGHSYKDWFIKQFTRAKASKSKQWKELRSHVKKAIITVPYGATAYGLKQSLEQGQKKWQIKQTMVYDTLNAAIDQITPGRQEIINHMKEAVPQCGYTITIPDGFEVRNISYKKLRKSINTGQKKHTVKVPTGTIDSQKLSNRVFVNYIHALDSLHISLCIAGARAMGVKILPIHDCIMCEYKDVHMIAPLPALAYEWIYINNCPLRGWFSQVKDAAIAVNRKHNFEERKVKQCIENIPQYAYKFTNNKFYSDVYKNPEKQIRIHCFEIIFNNHFVGDKVKQDFMKSNNYVKVMKAFQRCYDYEKGK